nr:MAG TPA_asm: transcription factor IIS-like protein [Caudoviricetes sp.]
MSNAENALRKKGSRLRVKAVNTAARTFPRRMTKCGSCGLIPVRSSVPRFLEL